MWGCDGLWGAMSVEILLASLSAPSRAEESRRTNGLLQWGLLTQSRLWERGSLTRHISSVPPSLTSFTSTQDLLIEHSHIFMHSQFVVSTALGKLLALKP